MKCPRCGNVCYSYWKKIVKRTNIKQKPGRLDLVAWPLVCINTIYIDRLKALILRKRIRDNKDIIYYLCTECRYNWSDKNMNLLFRNNLGKFRKRI